MAFKFFVLRFKFYSEVTLRMFSRIEVGGRLTEFHNLLLLDLEWTGLIQIQLLFLVKTADHYLISTLFFRKSVGSLKFWILIFVQLVNLN